MFIYFFAIFLQLASCSHNDPPADGEQEIDYRAEMRSLVKKISDYSKSRSDGFLVVPQNGISLVTENGNPEDQPSFTYLESIDACGQESLFYGYKKDNKATPARATRYTTQFLEIAKAAGKTILVTDYAQTEAKILDAYEQNQALGFRSFGAVSRELDEIPAYPDPVFEENSGSVTAIGNARNFLYLLNYDAFDHKESLLTALEKTTHDLIIMDLFFHDQPFSEADLQRIRTKPQGGERILLSYFSIGEAEDYRYYWDAAWDTDQPEWMEKENPDWEGNYKVRYWKQGWQDQLFGNDNAYLDRILEAGFDGAYLDIIDAYEYFEGL